MENTLDADKLTEALKSNENILSFFVDDVIKLVNMLPDKMDDIHNSDSCLTLLNGYWEHVQDNYKLAKNANLN